MAILLITFVERAKETNKTDLPMLVAITKTKSRELCHFIGLDFLVAQLICLPNF